MKTRDSLIKLFFVFFALAVFIIPAGTYADCENITFPNCTGSITFCTVEEASEYSLSGSSIIFNGGSIGTTGSDGCITISDLPCGSYCYGFYATQTSLSREVTRTINGVNYTISREITSASDYFSSETVYGAYTPTYTLTFAAIKGSARFHVTSCDGGKPISGAELWYKDIQLGKTNSDGYFTLNNIYPDVYDDVRAAPTGSDAEIYNVSSGHIVEINSDETTFVDICLPKKTGSWSGEITDVNGNPISNAYLCLSGSQYGGGATTDEIYPTNAAGEYSFPKLPATTYSNVTACGVSGMEDVNFPVGVDITVTAGANTTHNFQMKSKIGEAAVVWNTPSDNQNISSDQNIDFSITIYPPTADTYNDVKLDFKIDGATIGTETHDFVGGSSYTYTLSVPASNYTAGAHTADIDWYYGDTPEGSLVSQRTFNIVVSGTGIISGQVTNCNTGPGHFWIIPIGIPSATVNFGSGSTAVTGSWGDFFKTFLPGTYNVYASKSGYTDSSITTVDLSAGESKTVNLCLSDGTGDLAGTIVDSNGVPQNNVGLYYNGTYILNTSDYAGASPGVFFLNNIPAGSYNNVTFSKGGQTSQSYQITISPGATTIMTFTIPALSPTPTLTVNLTADPVTGNAPLNNVDLKAEVGGTATGQIAYGFDCNNDGVWEKTYTTGNTSYTAVDLCNYPTAGNYTAKVKIKRGGLTAYDTTNISVGSVSPTPTYLDIGLRIYDGSKIVSIAVESTLSSPLRIAKNGKIYSVALVDVNDSKASNIRVKTSSGIKALRKL